MLLLDICKLELITTQLTYFCFNTSMLFGRSLIAGGVQLNLMFKGVAVKIICLERQLVNIM